MGVEVEFSNEDILHVWSKLPPQGFLNQYFARLLFHLPRSKTGCIMLVDNQENKKCQGLSRVPVWWPSLVNPDPPGSMAFRTVAIEEL